MGFSSISSMNYTIPAEIVKQGRTAIRAYNTEPLGGKQRLNWAKLMFVGQERVGKSSLLRNLTSQAHDPQEAGKGKLAAQRHLRGPPADSPQTLKANWSSTFLRWRSPRSNRAPGGVGALRALGDPGAGALICMCLHMAAEPPSSRIV